MYSDWYTSPVAQDSSSPSISPQETEQTFKVTSNLKTTQELVN